MVTMETSQLLLMMMMMKTKMSFPDGTWTLSSPLRLHMDSVDMRHVLRWRPLQDNCSAPILYSVQYQGEFELTVLNSSWLDAPRCQMILEPGCDLTSALGSDSDYSLRVRAHCRGRESAWTTTNSTFNRRETFVSAPLMTVMPEGDGLQVTLNTFPVNTVVTVTVWRSGEELQAAAFTLLPEQTVLHVPLQVGGKYCIIAEARLGARSNSTPMQCVNVTHTGSGWWKTVATVVATAVVMVTLLVAVSWSISRCRPVDCQTYFRKEALPPSLQSDWDVTFMSSSEEAEPVELVSVVLVSTEDRRAQDLLLQAQGSSSSRNFQTLN